MTVLEWISDNIVTIAAIAAVALMVFFAARQMIRDNKKGCSSCGGSCSSCPYGCTCRKANDPDKSKNS